MFEHLIIAKKKEHNIQCGWRVYQDIKKKYGVNTVICVSQHPAIGDSFLVGLYLDAYYNDTSYVVTAISNRSEETYRYLGINHIVRLTQEETNNLISFCQFCGISREEVNVLHYQALCWHTGIAWNFNGVKDINFADLIETFVFLNLERDERNYPVSIKNTDLEKKLEGDGLKKGKTVVFFPYANTLIEPPNYIWGGMIEKFKNKGYSLATYIYNDEHPLADTQSISGELKDLITICEYAGTVVGVRNGLMDIIGKANCKKIVLYPKHGAQSWIHGSIKDFWSLKGFGYCEDVEEYEY